MAFHQAGNLDRAEQGYRAILAAQAFNGGALHMLGVLEAQRGHLEAARGLIASALKVNPRSPVTHSDLANVFLRQGAAQAALASCDRALALNPNLAQALNNRGAALARLRRSEEALTCYDRALAIKPGYVNALRNRGITLRELGRQDAALASYDRALALKPDFAGALESRGELLAQVGRNEDAIKDFEQALRLDPDLRFGKGALSNLKMRCCDWGTWVQEAQALIADVRAGKPTVNPFVFLNISASPMDQRRCAEMWIRAVAPPAPAPLWTGERYRHDRIRVAYLSADFREHPLGYLMAGLFERHDRERFEVTAVSFGPDAKSPMRSRLERAFERFVDVRQRSDLEVASLLRELEIDIAVDRNGTTVAGRPGVLALRPAPIQVNYLAYPGTMGADCIDYIVADRIVIPPDEQDCYAEKVIYLPDTYQVNDAARPIAARTPMRSEAGLPDTAFVFGCFNNSYKITPTIFDVWMRLLGQVDGSVLWLLQTNVVSARNLRREAARRGVAPDRLVFAGIVDNADHLARHRLADLILDTLPYNAHTATSDALWAGVPVLTCLGSAFAGRVAASLLTAVGLPELIAPSLETYEAQALELATNPTLLAAIRDQLARNRTTHPLFDTDLSRRHVEAAYVEMWERYQRGEAASGFAVAQRVPASRSPA